MYAYFEMSMDVSWLAFRLQYQSEVMKGVILQVEQYIDTVVSALIGDSHLTDPVLRKSVRSVLHPLFYRTLRLHGGFEQDECILFSSNIIANSYKISEEKGQG
ncbi:hypothetical protein PAAL109150_23925 [Paenibacillus alkaliterrae]